MTPPRGWVRGATWVAVLAPVPYSLSRLLWAAGIAVGIDREFLDTMHAPGVGSLFLVALAGLSEATAAVIAVFLLRRERTVPRWVPRLGGRPTRPRLVAGLLALPLAILTWRSLEHLALAFDGFRAPADLEDVPTWSLWAHVAVTWTWTSSLAVALASYVRDARTAVRRPASSRHRRRPERTLTPSTYLFSGDPLTPGGSRPARVA